MDDPVSHGLGFGHGSLIEHPDGTIEYRQTGKLLPAFRVAMADIVGFSVRRATRDDKKRLKASGLQQVITVQGSGTTLAEAAVNHGTAQRIEDWFRSRPDVAGAATPPAGAPTPVGSDALAPVGSVADELAKLVALREAGVLTPEEFDVQKAKLLE